MTPADDITYLFEVENPDSQSTKRSHIRPCVCIFVVVLFTRTHAHTRTHTHIHTDDINYSFEVDDPDSQSKCETFSINVSPESTDYSAASQRTRL